MSEATPRRKLAAILAADAVGFSKLMGANEELAFKTLRASRSLIDAAIKDNHGRIFHTAGDSVIAEFGSAVDAMVSAVEFQRNLKNRNSSLSPEEQMHFRVGLNIGDVIIEGDNLYGDGVNVASRLESCADPGGITLSGKFHDEVVRKLDLSFTSTGNQEMKNIAQPVPTFKVEIANINEPNTSKTNVSEQVVSLKTTNLDIENQKSYNEKSKPPAIAVLPFANMSGDEEQEYFADGITEDIITNLSLWKTFPVISRNSSFTYKGKSVNLKGVAEELGVKYIVEGSVRKGGNKVRITAQLIDATDDHHLWSKRWDRNLDDIFEVQDEVSTAIAALVSPAVKGQEGEKVSRKQVKNINAWDEYLRALSAYNNDGSPELVKELCENSIKLDPSLSDAYILLCNTVYFQIFNHKYKEQRKENELYFHKNAQKAIKLDSENPEALIVLSRSYNLRKDFEKRVTMMEKAVKINPNHAAANFDYGMSLTNKKDFLKAKEFIEKAIELSPTGQDAAGYKFGFWFVNIGLRSFDDALQSINEHIEKEGDDAPTGIIGFKASILAHLNRLDDARETLKQYQKLRPEIKNLTDYEKVAPTIIKDILLEGLEKAGLPNH